MQRLYMGTSGWNYPHWKGMFYPYDAEGVAVKNAIKFRELLEKLRGVAQFG